MKKFIYKDHQGDWCEAKINGINNAMPYIERRIERSMPVETIEVAKIRELVSSMKVTCHRDLTKEEANKLVTTILGYIIGQIDKADKYYVDRSAKIESKKGE